MNKSPEEVQPQYKFTYNSKEYLVNTQKMLSACAKEYQQFLIKLNSIQNLTVEEIQQSMELEKKDLQSCCQKFVFN